MFIVDLTMLSFTLNIVKCATIYSDVDYETLQTYQNVKWQMQNHKYAHRLQLVIQ